MDPSFVGAAASLCLSALIGAVIAALVHEGRLLPAVGGRATAEPATVAPPCVCHCDFSVRNDKDFEIYLVVGVVVAVALLFFLLGWCARAALAGEAPSPGKGKHRPVYTLASLQQ